TPQPCPLSRPWGRGTWDSLGTMPNGGVAQRQSGGLQTRASAGSIPASPAIRLRCLRNFGEGRAPPSFSGRSRCWPLPAEVISVQFAEKEREIRVEPFGTLRD